MRVARDYYYGDDLPIHRGDAGAIHHPYELTDEEADELAAELRDKLARRRQPGFTARWPDDHATL